MARIPTLSDSPRARAADPLTPTRSPREAAAPFNQISSLADQIGQGLNNIRRKQQAEADKVTYTKSNIALDQVYNEVTRQADEEYKAGKPNYDGYSQDVMSRMEASKQAIIKEAPESVKNSISLSFDQKMQRFEEKSFSSESRGKSLFAMSEGQNTVKVSASKAYGTPYSTEAAMSALQEATQIKTMFGTSSQYDPKQKSVLMNRTNEIPKALIGGVLAREDRVELADLKRDLESEEGQVLFGAMDPRLREDALNDINRKLASGRNEGLSSLKTRQRSAVAGFKNGTNSGSPEENQAVDDLKNDLYTSMGEEARPLINEIEAHQASSAITNKFAFNLQHIDSESLATKIASDDPDLITRMGSAGKAKGIIEAKIQSMQAEQKKDFGSYLHKYSPKAQLLSKGLMGDMSQQSPESIQRDSDAYFNFVEHKAREAGVKSHNITYLSPELKDHFGGSIKEFIDRKDYKSAAIRMEQFDMAMGGQAHRMMEELDLPQDLAILSEMVDGNDRINTLSILGDPDFDKKYKTIAKDRQIDDKLIASDLRENDLFNAMTAQDGGTLEGTAHSEAMFNAVHREFKRQVLTNPGLGQENAKKEAWKIFEKRYATVEQNGNPIPIPRQYNSENAQNFLDIYSGTADYVADLEVALPVKDGVQTTKEEMNNALSGRNRWVLNRKSGGLVLQAQDESGRYRYVPHKDGGPIIKTFEQLDSETYGTDKKKERARDFINIIGRKREPSDLSI